MMENHRKCSLLRCNPLVVWGSFFLLLGLNNQQASLSAETVSKYPSAESSPVSSMPILTVAPSPTGMNTGTRQDPSSTASTVMNSGKPNDVFAQTAHSAPPEAAPRPGLVTLKLSDKLSIDTEIIQWTDGTIALPVKALGAILDQSVQYLPDEQRLFFVDSTTQRRIAMDWQHQEITVDDAPLSSVGRHPLTRNTSGFLIKDDVYVDSQVLADLLQCTFRFDNDTTTLSLSTQRKLKLTNAATGDENPIVLESNMTVIRDPKLSARLIDRISLNNTSAYGYQVSRQPQGGDRLRSTYLMALVDTPTVGISGTILGQSYYLKPSFIHYNGKTTLQGIDWSIQHDFKNSVVSVGSTDVGLSPLTTPALTGWVAKWASRNATTSFLQPRSDYEFSAQSKPGHEVTIKVNDRPMQTLTSADGHYDFDPVYLQSQTINDVEILDKDPETSQETVLRHQKIGTFQNMLPKGESAYTAFAGRAPLQFFPIIPDEKTPFLMPQSEKWMAGGRYFYGLTNRLTMGLSAAGDQIFGKPDSYYKNLNPFTLDLTGFSSYQRDANYFSGENTALTLRYQLSNHWMVSADGGLGQYRLKPGSLLRIPESASGKALQLHLEHQGTSLSYFVEAFHYDPYYYTPSATLYGNTLYDKQGLGAGVNGNVSTFFKTSYSVRWNRYQTNLQKLIAGGIVNANQIQGNINTQLNLHNTLGFTSNLTGGKNHEREFIQRAFTLNYHTESLPWHITGDVLASHYFTNTLFYPSTTLDSDLIDAPYTNNLVQAEIDVPLGKLRKNHLRFGSRFSSFVNYGFIQGVFQYHQLFFEPLVQLSYGDKPQTQDRVGARAGYQFKSGARFSIAYYKNISSFISPLNNVPTSRVKMDQWYVDFSDVLGILGDGIHSLGPNADSQASLTGRVFADYQQNGKSDKTEPGIKAVKLVIDKHHTVVTNEKGVYTATGLSPGYHTVEILPDNIPLTLNAENPTYKIKCTDTKTYQVDFPLAPEGGFISGNISLETIVGETIKQKDLVLVLLNNDGKVLNYTTADEQGAYKFSNIGTGEYKIDLEPHLKNSGRYKILSTPSQVMIEVPKDYNMPITIKHQDFKLLVL
jgi:hypothetical protein